MSSGARKAPEVTAQWLDGPAGRLQARYEVPPDDAGAAYAVVCHPHPLHQGSMDNKVVHTLARACNRLGVPAVRFNFRGVGESEGEYGEGEGELDDTLAVIDHISAQWPDRTPWLLGFSFGGVIAARAAMRRAAGCLVTVAPAVTRLALEFDAARMPPWLLVQGEDDDVVPTDEVRSWVQRNPAGPQLVLVPAAGHFFHGRLNALGEAVTEFLQSPGSQP